MTSPVVVFGAGAVADLAGVLDDAGWRRAMLVTTPGRGAEADRIAGILGPRLVARFDRAAPHVPAQTIDDAMATIAGAPDGLDGIAVIVAIGGGSAIGLAKALALRTSRPIVAIPTTYSGSEMTSIWGITEAGEKRTGRDPRVAPAVVVYDAELTVSLPPDVSAASGMNAMAHAVEALYAANASEAIRRRAEQAAATLAGALPDVVARPADLDARERAFRGAHDAGAALAGAAMGLHHRLCHVLGGRFGLPHALTHAVLLPYVAAFNAPAAPEAMARLATALGVSDAPAGLAALNQRLGIVGGLEGLGLRESDLDDAAAEATGAAYSNPRPASAAEAGAILEAAMHARAPGP